MGRQCPIFNFQLSPGRHRIRAMQTVIDHLYVHVPFCDGKCHYCTFYSELYDHSRASAYIDCVAQELDALLQSSPSPRPATIYIGGGTPSVLSASLLARLCAMISERTYPTDTTEWTVEVNPGTLSAEKVAVLAESGVNRISIGAQSFDDITLQSIGRRHTAGDIVDCLTTIRSAGIVNIGLDLISSLPGVDDNSWRRSLETALANEPSHMSIYSLTMEAGSRFGDMISAGTLTDTSQDKQLEALAIAEDILTSSGMERYEISNFAAPGCECVHNRSFWRGEDYIGIGPAASSRSGRQRWTNTPDIDSYCAAVSEGKDPIRHSEVLSQARDLSERLMFRFRLAEGVAVDDIPDVPTDLADQWRQTLQRLSKNGLVQNKIGRWSLTSRGRDMADLVAEEFSSPCQDGILFTAQRGNHTAHQLTVSVEGKTHTVYVPMDMIQDVTEDTRTQSFVPWPDLSAQQ